MIHNVSFLIIIKEVDTGELCMRLRQSVDYLRLNELMRTQADMARQLGVLRPNLSAALNGDPKRLTKRFLSKFLDAYGDYINAQWLLTGEGEMERKDPHKFKPNVPLTVAAGFMGGSVESALLSGCEMLPIIPTFPDYDFTIRVAGDSMCPKLKDGDLIACCYLDGVSDLRENGIYVVETRDGAAVKQICLDGKTLVCSSINPKYESSIIPVAMVVKLAQVVGVVRNM